ncbi:hypothetical protein [Nocardia sp. NPDC058480]
MTEAVAGNFRRRASGYERNSGPVQREHGLPPLPSPCMLTGDSGNDEEAM